MHTLFTHFLIVFVFIGVALLIVWFRKKRRRISVTHNNILMYDGKAIQLDDHENAISE